MDLSRVIDTLLNTRKKAEYLNVVFASNGISLNHKKDTQFVACFHTTIPSHSKWGGSCTTPARIY